MKVLILVLALFAVVYSDEEVESGYIDDPNNLPPGYVLQPDGTYLLTITEEGQTIVRENVVNEDEYDIDDLNPPFSNGVITIGQGDDKGHFKISHGYGDNENDYSVEAVNSPDDPTSLNSNNKDDPKVYTDGTQGQPDYDNTLGVGRGSNRVYLKMRPDSSRPSGFKYIPQYITGFRKIPGRVQEDETDEPEEDDLPDNPEISKKPGYSVISIGRPNCRRYIKLTPSKTSNPYEFDLKAIKHPNQPDSKPDDDDDDAPEVISNGKRGTPEYEPIIASGPSNNRRYVKVIVNKKHPNRFTFASVNPKADPGEVTTEPNEDEVEYEDVPKNPTYITVKVPGRKFPTQIVSVGQPGHRGHFKIIRRSDRPGDVEVAPILNPDHPNSPPDPNDEFAPEVCEPGDPLDPNNAPIVATGPRFKRVYHRMIITRKGVRFIPVARRRIKGRYIYRLKKRIYHPIRRVIRKVVVHKNPATFVTTTTVVKRPRGFFGGLFGGLFGGHSRPANGVRRVVVRKPGGQAYGQKIITTSERIVDRGFHPTRPKIQTTTTTTTTTNKGGGGFLFGKGFLFG